MTRLRRCSVIWPFIAFVAAAAQAGVPTYSTIQLQARSNFCVNPSGAFNLPCDHFFNSSTPDINDAGEWAAKLNVMGATGSQGILFGVNGTAIIGYTSPADASLSDPTLNNSGFVVFPQTFAAPNGIYFYNSDSMTNGLLTSQPAGASAWGNPTVNDTGQVGFRATFSGSGQTFYSYDGTPTLATHATEAGLTPRSPYSFLFTPSFNNARQIAGKVRLGAAGQTGNSQPDQIRIFNADGTSTLIAEDRDSNASSPYTSFDNSVSLTNDGWVAFTANLFAGGRGVFLSNGTTTLTIATTTGTPGVTVIEFFAPSANNGGLVAFRGRDAANLYAIFVGDGTSIRRVIGEHDLVPTDQGTGRIDQHDSSVVFGGSPAINDAGDIIFNAALTPPDNNQIEWGSGIFIADADAAAIPGDANGDGVVDVNDLLLLIGAWGECDPPPPPPPPSACPADFNGDGVVDVNDLLILIGNWG